MFPKDADRQHLCSPRICHITFYRVNAYVTPWWQTHLDPVRIHRRREYSFLPPEGFACRCLSASEVSRESGQDYCTLFGTGGHRQFMSIFLHLANRLPSGIDPYNYTVLLRGAGVDPAPFLPTFVFVPL